MVAALQLCDELDARVADEVHSEQCVAPAKLQRVSKADTFKASFMFDPVSAPQPPTRLSHLVITHRKPLSQENLYQKSGLFSFASGWPWQQLESPALTLASLQQAAGCAASGVLERFPPTAHTVPLHIFAQSSTHHVLPCCASFSRSLETRGH